MILALSDIGKDSGLNCQQEVKHVNISASVTERRLYQSVTHGVHQSSACSVVDCARLLYSRKSAQLTQQDAHKFSAVEKPQLGEQAWI